MSTATIQAWGVLLGALSNVGGMRMRWLAVVASAGLFLSSCSGRISGYSGPTTGNAVGPEVLTPQQVQAAMTQCGEPHGPAVAPTTCGEMRSRLLGAWFTCSADGDATLTSRIASPVLYEPDGQWHYLGLDAQGGLVRLDGVDHQGTWRLSDGDWSPCVDPSAPAAAPGVLLVDWDSGGSNGGSVSFEFGPQRMQWQPDYSTEWYVPLPAVKQ